MVLQKNFRNRSNLPRLTFLYELPSKGQSIFPLLLASPRLHKRSLAAGPTRKQVRRTSFSSAGGLAETTARADRIVTHSLPGGFIFAILLGVGRNWGAMGNTGDTGKAQCPEHLFALIWSQEQRLYELHTQNRLEQRFQPTDEATWQSWLREVTSFAFHSPAGSLNVYLERRPHGGAYWYAYQTKEGRTRKRYLGRTETLSLAHLEETARSLRREQQPPQAFDRGMLVLSGRLAPPRLPAALVEREPLLSALDGALATPLTLLSAPAGFGKTTLLATWARRHEAQVAWLSLEELDTSPTRFWVALIAALRRYGGYAPSFGQTAVALLESPQPPPLPTILAALLQEL